MIETEFADDDFDYDLERYEDYECERCGGDGFVEYDDSPDLWGEDCPSLVNHLIVCPACSQRITERMRKTTND